MRRFGLVSSAFVVSLMAQAGVASAADWFVDAENGTDVSNTTCGQNGAGMATGPCATLNHALLEASAGDTIWIENAGVFGPINLTGSISINGPAAKVKIGNDGTAPGCIHAAAGSCGLSASASNAAITITAGATDVIKLKSVLAAGGPSSTSSISIQSAFVVAMTDVTVRINGNNTTATAQVLDQSSLPTSGSPHQLYMHNCDVAFSTTAGDVYVVPTVPTAVHFSGGELHHAKFGYRSDATGLSSGSVNTVVDGTEFFAFNTNAVTVFATGSAPANVELARSTITQTGTNGLVVDGANASAVLFEDVITETTTGVNILGGKVYSLGNNQIYFNGTNISGGSLTSGPPSLQ
jgi:hypothetical protein